MASVTVRKLDDEVKRRLHQRAAEHGQSMEAEIREILGTAVKAPAREPNSFVALMDYFTSIGGVDLELPERSTPVRVVDLS